MTAILLQSELVISVAHCLFLAFLFKIGACASPLWGSIADTMPRRGLIVAGAVTWGIVTLLLACCTQFWQFILLRMLNGAALAVIGPLSQSIMTDVFPNPLDLGRVFGFVQLFGCLGAMVASIYATTISQKVILGFHGWR